MVTPFDHPDLLDVWRAECNDACARGETVSGAYRHIANRYGCSITTVRRHLDNEYAARQRAAGRRCGARARQMNGGAIWLGVFADPEYRRRYIRNKQRVDRDPAKIIDKIFIDQNVLELDQIRDRTTQFCEGIEFGKPKIRRVLHQYSQAQIEGRARGPPYLREIRPDVWRYE